MKNLRRLLPMLLLSATLFLSIPMNAQTGTDSNGTTDNTYTETRDDNDNTGLWGLLGLLGLAGLLGKKRNNDHTTGNTNINR